MRQLPNTGKKNFNHYIDKSNKMLNRNNRNDAKNFLEDFIENESQRSIFINFLCSAIEHAHSINSSNWNLNLDNKGKYLRFNIGQEYCIQLDKEGVLIICDKTNLKSITKKIPFEIIYKGYNNGYIHSNKIENVPNLLAKTPNNVGCLIKTSDISEEINRIKDNNFIFIENGIKTTILPQMKAAHSIGAIAYLSSISKRKIPNPNYLPNLDDILKMQQKEIESAVKLSKEKRNQKLKNINPKPDKIITQTSVFSRNAYVVAEVMERANGYCERCKCQAPFIRDRSGLPYLEVHHIVPLAENGDDTVENAIALCPNCHKHAHYGKKTY